MLRQKSDWNFTLEWLSKRHKDGIASVRSAMVELEAAGYVTRGDQQRSEAGKFTAADYVVREIPADGDLPACENRTRTACDFPMTENPISENQTQISTNTVSTNPVIPPKSPQRGRRGKREKAVCEYEPEAFERFWKLYPRGEDKAAARYEWDELKPDPALMRAMSAALKRQLKTDEWQRGVGIPYACRWLSKRRWEAADKLKAEPALTAEEHTAEEVGARW